MVKAGKKNSNATKPLSKHDQILGKYQKPFWLLNSSLLDNAYTVRTHGGNLRRGDVTLCFDVVIAPGVRLTDLEDDLITAKLLVIEGLSGSDARYEAGSSIAQILRSYCVFLRWRVANGIWSNAELTKDWFDQLLEDIAARGIRALPPYRERLEDLRSRIETGQFQIPWYSKGKQRVARMRALTEELGAPNQKSLPAGMLAELDELARGQGLITGKRKVPERNASDDEGKDESALSENRLIGFLTPVHLLHYYRDALQHDQIGFAPFENERGIAAVAQTIARVERQRRFTIPPFQGCFLVDRALTWVTVYFDEIKQFVEDLKQTALDNQTHWRPHERAFKLRLELDRDRYSTGPGSWWPVHPSYFPSPGWVDNVGKARPALRTVLFEFLGTAAFVVIAAFTARRSEELDSLRDDCLTFEDGEFWLQSWISKNLKALDKLPVPATVAQAIEVLKWLSAEGRQENGTAWLLQFAEKVPTSDVESSVTPRYDAYGSLDRFAEFVQLPLLHGKRWIPKPTEFRRFFGMIYFHRFDYPSLVALSEFYRHFNPTRTRGYILELSHGTTVRRSEERAERRRRQDQRRERFAHDRVTDFEEAGLDFRIKVLRDAVTGDDYLRGRGGDLLMKDFGEQVKLYASQLELTREELIMGPQLDDILEIFAGPLSIEPHPVGHSFCKCSSRPVDLKAANCLKKRAEVYPEAAPPSGPDIEFATPDACANCAHNVQRSCNASWWSNALEHNHHESEHALLPFLQEAASKKVELVGDVIGRCHSRSAGPTNV